MQFASEVLDHLVGPPALPEEPRGRIQVKTNMDINAHEDENWFDNLLSNISEETGQDAKVVASKARAIMARAEAIRYVQLGNPETMLIDDGEPKMMGDDDAANGDKHH
jgi:hypothetical protein